MYRNDRLFGGFMLVVAMAYGARAFYFPAPFGGGEIVGPGTFPKLLAAVAVLASLYLILKPDPDQPWPAARTGLEIVIASIVLILYALALVPLGFILATWAAVGTLIWRMGAPALRAYGVGLAAGVVVYFLFTLGLSLPLPTGPLIFLDAL